MKYNQIRLLVALATGLIAAPDLRAQGDRSSRMDLLKNGDGPVDIYFGPTAQEGKQKNWIPTVPGRDWFSYFRFYSPTEAYFDRSWVLPDIKKASW